MIKSKLRIGLTACITILMATFTMAGTSEAWTRRYAPPRYWSGPRFRELPRDYRVIRYNRYPYYFSYGRYYRRGPSGFYLALPPIGLVVPVLPFGYASVVIGGLTYYELNGIYYRQVPEGYRVVETPQIVEKADLPPAAENGQSVVVQSELLNVRTGPGLEQEILTEVSRGKVLKVLGKIPEWYYVELPDGQLGWVMEKFVIPERPVPEG